MPKREAGRGATPMHELWSACAGLTEGRESEHRHEVPVPMFVVHSVTASDVHMVEPKEQHGVIDVAVAMRAALQAFTEQAAVSVLRERVATLESQVGELAARLEAVESTVAEARKQDERLTEELLELLSDVGGLPAGDVPKGYSVADVIEE